MLSHFRIAEKIGEGGMGEVWRATDTDLGRDVAIKVLPQALANDVERLARFEREGRLLASLSHPNIATIHGLHESDSDGLKVRYLVMEIVEGEDLVQAVEQGLSLEACIEIAIQIARALEAAHASGIVHRDLKPANVKRTMSGEIKVLDFGLAKAVGFDADSSGGADPTMSPTITSAGTVPGTILGTAAYMSPEQARGLPVDRRADMWAFGCVLYELLTGQRAFSGETISDTLVAVLKEAPDWTALPEGTPPGIRRLLRRCLEKDQRKRWSDAADARLELEEALETGSEEGQEMGSELRGAEAVTTASSGSPILRLVPWLVAAVGIALAFFAWSRGDAVSSDSRNLLSLAIPLEGGLRIEDEQFGNVVLSPDASFVVFSGIDEAGQSALFVRSLRSKELVRLPGTENAENPFVSPDGSWIGYFSEGRIKKVPAGGGPPVEICDEIGSSRGASWGYDNRIVFPRHFDTGLWQVTGSGGEPTPLTELDADRRERTHRWPFIVPGHPIALFTVATKDSPEYYDDALIDAVNLETGERKTIFDGASFAWYVPTGHLIVGRSGSLWAVPFDIEELSTTGPAAPVLPNVMGLRNSGVVFASIASNGMLAYVEGQPEDQRRELRWRYLDGRSEVVSEVPIGMVLYVELSPDGRRIAASIAGAANYDIWVFDLESRNRTRLTFEGNNGDPHWTPDGQRIFYNSVRDGRGMVFRKEADGTGDEELIWEVDGVTVDVHDVRHDGKAVLLGYWGGKKSDLYTLALDDPSAVPEPLLDGPSEEDLARYSPDDRWLAFTTDESGDFEVLVRPVSGQGGRWQISTGPGILPRWSRDGKQLFYRTGRELYVVDIEAGAGSTAFATSNPRRVFDDLSRASLTSSYDVSLAGDAILIPSSLQDNGSMGEITVLVNWLDEVERLVPAESP